MWMSRNLKKLSLRYRKQQRTPQFSQKQLEQNPGKCLKLRRVITDKDTFCTKRCQPAKRAKSTTDRRFLGDIGSNSVRGWIGNQNRTTVVPQNHKKIKEIDIRVVQVRPSRSYTPSRKATRFCTTAAITKTRNISSERGEDGLSNHATQHRFLANREFSERHKLFPKTFVTRVTAINSTVFSHNGGLQWRTQKSKLGNRNR